MAQTRPRQNFHQKCEENVNKQINLELYAEYLYTSMAYHFNRDDVALLGLSKYFAKMAEGERKDAERFMEYQNKRGGRIVLKNLQKPERDDWGSAVESMKAALTLEKSVNQSLLDMHNTAGEHKDHQFTNFLETYYLDEQVETIKEIADHITRLEKVGPGLGEHIYDQQLLLALTTT